VVLFEWASELLVAASHLPKACPIVTRLHRYEMYQWAHQVNWDAVDRVILVSQAKLREFTARYPQHAAKAVMIPEAVSLSRFQPSGKPYGGDIGILCHVRPRKRVYELVLAFYELTRRRGGFHLHIGGGRATGVEEYYEAVVQLVERLGLRDRVTFYGHVERPEDWYPRIDVIISNGYSEGLQVSPLEAMATGCYCLSHWWDGADELLPEDQLYHTNTDLIDRLIQYADAPEADRARARERMQSIVRQRFDVSETKRRIRTLVEEAVASPAA
jgi:glycosyltransferase involved in cell wall biosynthesis